MSTIEQRASEPPWTCGHVAGAMCAECHRLLAGRAHELAEENARLRALIDELNNLLDATMTRDAGFAVGP